MFRTTFLHNNQQYKKCYCIQCGYNPTGSSISSLVANLGINQNSASTPCSHGVNRRLKYAPESLPPLTPTLKPQGSVVHTASLRYYCTFSQKDKKAPTGGAATRCSLNSKDAARQVCRLAADHAITVVIKEGAPLRGEVLNILQPHCVEEHVKIECAQVDDSTAEEILRYVNVDSLPIIYLRGNCIGGVHALQELERKRLTREHIRRHSYDLIVIGGGSGGLSAAKEAARLGRKVACIDFVKPSPLGTVWGLGGTCVNVGCIPKKLMHQASLIGSSLTDSAAFGWKLPAGTVVHDWHTATKHIQDHIASLNWGYRVQLRENSVNYVNGYGNFLSSHEVAVTEKSGKVCTLTADKFLIAVGLRPRYLNVPGATECCITSDDLFSLPYNPGKTLCIGASYIALECAGFLKGMGIDVTVMVRSVLLRGFDANIAHKIKIHLSAKGIKFINAVPLAFEAVKQRTESAPGLVKVTFEKTNAAGVASGPADCLMYDTVLLAIGREAKTDDIGCDIVGIDRTASGKIIGSLEQSRSAPHIYAVGDILEESPELTPVAIQAGRALMRRLFAGSLEITDYENVPTTIFTPLEYGCCGLSEEDARKKYGGGNVTVYHNTFTPVEHALLKPPKKSRSYIKLICKNQQDEIIGLHVVSPNAGEIMQGLALAIKLKATKADFDHFIGVHPTIAEFFTHIKRVKKE